MIRKIKKYTLISLFLVAGAILKAPAQESLSNQAMVSPEVWEDGRVTFRLKAPEV